VATGSATSQTPCEPGTYQPIAGKMGCTEASLDHYVEESAAISQTPCPDGFSQPDIGMISCIEDEATFPLIAIAGGVVVLAIAGIMMKAQKKPKSHPKRGKRKPPKGKRRRPPKGKRKRPRPAKAPSTEPSQEEE